MSKNYKFKLETQYNVFPEDELTYRANLLYDFPVISDAQIGLGQPVYYNNQPVSLTYNPSIRDLNQEQDLIARTQKAVKNYIPQKQPNQRLDFIDKIGNVKSFSAFSNQQDNIIMKPEKQLKSQKDYHNIAELFYPDMNNNSQVQSKDKIALLSDNNQPDIVLFDNYPTLADKDFIAKPIDPAFTGGAASISSQSNDIPPKYTNIKMLLPYLSGEPSIMQKLGAAPYKQFNYTNIDAGEYNASFSNNLKERLKQFLRKEENLKLKAYKVGKDVWTIGYGHTNGVKQGDIITKEEAEKFLDNDINEHIKLLKIIKAPLTDNQKIAMASLAFNLGGTKFRKRDIIKYLNNYNFESAANEFDLLVHSANGIEPGLVLRRKREKELFLKNENN